MSHNILDIQRIGKRKAWYRLGNRIRNIVINTGIPRLQKIRNVISEDANLPMPPICIEPFGYVAPGDYGAIFALVRLIPASNSYMFGVIMPVSTLVVIDDDMLLRQLLCHEFAHCFWLICHYLQAINSGKPEVNTGKRTDSELEILQHQIQVDKQQLINPEDWFGEWDTKHFIPEGTGIFNEATELFVERWLNAGLPQKTPSMKLEADGFLIEDEIMEHIRKLKQ